jgi:anti-sigma B factor antagonist
MDQLKIETETRERSDVIILRLAGPFTISTLFDFQNAVRTGAAAATIIDLSGVPYMDSAALGSLLGFHVSCQRSGRRYAVAGASPRLETLFQVTHVDKILSRFPTVEEAEKNLRDAAASAASGN